MVLEPAETVVCELGCILMNFQLRKLSRQHRIHPPSEPMPGRAKLKPTQTTHPSHSSDCASQVTVSPNSVAFSAAQRSRLCTAAIGSQPEQRPIQAALPPSALRPYQQITAQTGSHSARQRSVPAFSTTTAIGSQSEQGPIHSGSAAFPPSARRQRSAHCPNSVAFSAAAAGAHCCCHRRGKRVAASHAAPESVRDCRRRAHTRRRQ